MQAMQVLAGCPHQAVAMMPTRIPCRYRLPPTSRQSAVSGCRPAMRAAPGVRRTRHSAPMQVQAALGVGDRIQDSSEYYRVLKRSDGGSIALSKLKGQPLVLFFYPQAGTPGCTKQACKFRDEYGKFKDAGAVVFGISSDAPEKNKAFAESNRVPFPLLTDDRDFLRKEFGIKNDAFGFLKGRQTFVIDKNGSVVLSFNDQFGAEKHVEQALTAISKIKSGKA